MTELSTARSSLVRDAPAPPVRIVLIGLGAFSRSHLAWYTQHAADASSWGIAAYSGRSRALADKLDRQDGLYTLTERDAQGDRFEVVSSIVRAHPGDDLGALIDDISSPAVSIVTLTITEVGYRLDPDDAPDLSDPLVARDVCLLGDVANGIVAFDAARPQTTLVRVLLGLEARRRRESGPIALVSLDNLPDNGGRLERGMLALAASLSPELVDWISDSVSFPSSSVDRITPQIAEDELRELIVTTGDEAPVVAEPFSDWVVSGAFPGGRPQWETAGARFVDDLEPWEARKLWMLNGAHTLLACLGLLRGHRTVAESIGDPVCRAAVESLWNEDAACLPACLGLDEYRQALVDRFANARIEHRLEQIAADSFMKLRLRVVPVTEVLLRRGELPRAGAAAIAAWIVAARRGLLPPEATAPSAHSGAALSSLLTRLSDVVGASAPFADEVESIRVSYEEV